jgi:hypothetical protein
METAQNHLVILVHGINTRAKWLHTVKQELEANGFKVAFAGYGVVSVTQFLFPGRLFKRWPIELVKRRIDAAISLNKNSDVSIICHSFGSYIVSKLLSTKKYKFKRIVFCGSVVSNRFPFHDLLDCFEAPIINEIGTRDIWPAFAESVTWGYGSIGSYGFVGAPFEERYHKGAKHSDFFTKEFCRNYWLPFLLKGELQPAAPYTPQSLLSRTISLLRFKYWLAILGAFLIINWTNLIQITSAIEPIEYYENLSDNSYRLSDICISWLKTVETQIGAFEMAAYSGSTLVPSQTEGEIAAYGNLKSYHCFGNSISGPLVPLAKLYRWLFQNDRNGVADCPPTPKIRALQSDNCRPVLRRFSSLGDAE